MEPKTYRFSSFQELLANVPADRIADCMAELTDVLLMAAAANTVASVALTENGHAHDGPVYTLPEVLEWVDDGAGRVECRVQGVGVSIVSQREAL